MAHTEFNFRTKKDLKAAVEAGKEVRLQTLMFPPKANGTEFIEGPHEYHKWYAQVTMKDGIVVKVK